MKILGISIQTKKKPYTKEDFIAAAEACGYNKLIGIKLFEALTVYADGKVLDQKFLKKIPSNEIETIKGVKAAGHKIIAYMKV